MERGKYLFLEKVPFLISGIKENHNSYTQYFSELGKIFKKVKTSIMFHEIRGIFLRDEKKIMEVCIQGCRPNHKIQNWAYIKRSCWFHIFSNPCY